MSRVIEAVAASPFVQGHAQEARTLSRAGSGEEARVAAAHTSYPGELFLLLPRRSRR